MPANRPCGPDEENGKHDGQGHHVLVGQRQHADARRLQHADQEPGGHRGGTFPSPPSTAQVNPLTASEVPMSYWVWVRGETAQPASAPMAAARKKERVTREEARMPHSRAAVALEAHARIALPSQRGAEEERQRADHQRRDREDPEHLGRDARAQHGEGGGLIAGQEGQGVHLLVPDVQGGLAHEDGKPDGDDDHAQHVGFFSQERNTSCSSTPTVR